MPNDTHRKQIVSGFLWQFANQFSVQAAAFGLSIVLARLLTPEDYGLVGMVTVLTGFAPVLFNYSFGNSLIQQKDATDTDFSTIFWLSGGIGLGLFGAFAWASPWVAAFYGREELQMITVLIAFRFPADAFSVAYDSRCRKALDFKSVSLASLASLIVGGSVCVWLAAEGWGYHALFVKILLESYTRLAAFVALSSWRPRLEFSKQSFLKAFGYGSHLVGANIVNYWARNADNLVIGKAFGEEALSLYAKAYGFLLLPINLVSRLALTVMFPSLSMVQDQVELLRRRYLQAVQFVALATFPMMAGLYVCSEEVVLVCFGPAWAGVAPLLRWFAILGPYHALVPVNGVVFMSLGMTREFFYLSLVVEVVVIVAVLIGAFWGVEGVIVGLYVAAAINFYPSYYYVFESTKVSIGQYFYSLSGIAAVSLVLLVGLYALHWVLSGTIQSPFLLLGAELLVAVPGFALMAELSGIEGFRLLKQIFRERFLNKA